MQDPQESTVALLNYFKHDRPQKKLPAEFALKQDYAAAQATKHMKHLTQEARKTMSAFESLDYDHNYSQISRAGFRNKSKETRHQEITWKWLILLFVGVSAGLAAVALQFFAYLIIDFKNESVLELIRDGKWMWGYVCYATISISLVVFSAMLCLYVAPITTGGGIPEIKAVLNGVDYPKALSSRVLMVKLLGLIAATAGGLVVGKEGPMLHIGAVLAAGAASAFGALKKGLEKVPLGLRKFMNDNDKRSFMSAGAAAGIAAAFQAPTGGILFALEEASSFWSLKVVWKMFICAMVASKVVAFSLAFLSGSTSSGVITFGQISARSYHVLELIPFAFLGIMSGFLGAGFIIINTKLTEFRLKYVTSKKIQVLEAGLIALITATIAFWLPTFYPCRRVNADDDEIHNSLQIEHVQFTCDHEHYNPMATLLFNTQESAVRALFHGHNQFNIPLLLVFGSIYYVLMIATSGLAIPGGLMTPAILTGASLGAAVGSILSLIFPSLESHTGVFALIGASGMLGSIYHMTISLVVILVETTNRTSFVLPIMMSVMLGRGVAKRFTRSWLTRQMELKYIPFLAPEPRPVMKGLKASDVMSRSLKTLPEVVRVGSLFELLSTVKHNGFPVVDNKTIKGLILRSHLLILLKHKVFQKKASSARPEPLEVDNFITSVRSLVPTLDDLDLSDEEMDFYIDIRPYYNHAPHIVLQDFPLDRTFKIFRGLGLRHLLVVNNNQEPLGIITRQDLLLEFLKVVKKNLSL